jgi:hypothetical protein
MAKRFIDTGLFDDEWFAELNQDCKIFWIYFVTKCDHAGILKYNKKLIEFQTGIKSLDTVIKHFDNRLVRVNELLFCSKYITFQYPGFPNSNVMQQNGALKILIKNGLWDSETNNFKQLTNSSTTVDKDLTKSYVYDNVIVIDNVKEKKTIIFPFNSETFIASWDKWKQYKKEQYKFTFKGTISEQASLNELNNLSGKVESKAIAIIENAIAKSWQGLYLPKTETKTSSNPYKIQ